MTADKLCDCVAAAGCFVGTFSMGLMFFEVKDALLGVLLGITMCVVALACYER